MKPQTRVVEVEWFESCLSNQHVSAALVKCICVTFGFTPARVMAWMHDRCGVNGASFRLTLRGVFIGSDDNGCMGHTCMHVGEALGTDCLDDVLAPYNVMNAKSLYFRKTFVRKTGITPKKTSGTRWYGDIGAIGCLEEPLRDGTFVLVLEDMVERDLCQKSAVKALVELRDTRKLTVMKVEAAVVGFSGVEIKVCGRRLEGDGYEQVTGYSALRELEQKLENPLTPALLAKLAIIAVAAPQPAAPAAATATAIPTAPARPGRGAALANANCPAQVPAPAPVPPPPPATYKEILEYGDLSDVVVLKSLVRAIVKPALGYMEKVIFNTCSAQVARMKAAQAYDPIFAITNNITSGDVDELERLYRLFALPEYAGAADAMKEELATYKARITLIRPLAERLDSDGKDTFDIQVWWRENQAALPAWSSTLRAVLCHAPNSAPPERAFSILNDSIGDDQTCAKADYKKALMMLQYNNRGRD